MSLPKIFEEEKQTNIDEDMTEKQLPCAENNDRQLRSNNVLKTSNSRTGILEEKCIFCEKKDRKNKGQKEKLYLCQSLNMEMGIRQDAVKVKDLNFLGKISTLDFVAKEVRYHQLCRIEFANKAKAEEKKMNVKNAEWHQSRKVHNTAFESLSSFIDGIIIKEEEVHLLSDLHRDYMSIYEEADGGMTQHKSNFTEHHLAEKISKHYGEKVRIENFPVFGAGKLVFSSSISSEEALLKTTDPSQSALKKIREVALLLRKEILNLVKKPLPEKLTLQDIYEGEIQAPKMLSRFFQYLVAGAR